MRILFARAPTADAEGETPSAEPGLCLALVPPGALRHLLFPTSYAGTSPRVSGGGWGAASPGGPQTPPQPRQSCSGSLEGSIAGSASPTPSPAPDTERPGEIFYSKTTTCVLVGLKKKQFLRSIHISVFNSMQKILHRASANSAGVGNTKEDLKHKKRGLNV